MKKMLLVTFLMLAQSSIASASDFHPSRARLLIHYKMKLSSKWVLNGRFIPSPNLLSAPLTPIFYVGCSYQPHKWIFLGSYTGLYFNINQPFISASFLLNHPRVILRIQLDWIFPSHNGYWSANCEIKISKWFLFGLEGEGWGGFPKKDTWSHGGGPNIILRIGIVKIDLAIHFRYLNDEVKPEFLLKTHLFF